mmetsp:Transcript_26003/g.55632  ORF Transcript_26003/g.55632 Transcript_26003/m.55632 type:complete len:114 (-) Transcript_26003:81-422(-)|eukprot:CAMPEP_0197491174 /NCGR_PEP_ID=MMETSP1311-20131121/5504_1 /TAXON_ID=464262 /ORGANISM="Genus nov. species nov., Strain RCC856" /LENGTH=113 /DNA_ID=CAMNT_0043035801 /DNA_START=159 /DNA_END=500 /DNA_ORIENTATION=+
MDGSSGLDCSDPTPRVNFDLMQRYVGRKVKLVCKVEEFSGESVKVTTCDGQAVFVKPKQGSQYDTAFVEIEGVVENNTTVQEESFTSFGDSFDMKNYNELCKLSNGPTQELFL